ncbi:MAG: sigma-70 family RNA polymerase sigma factor [Bacteroidia bacterium]|nr:sigma-70 family RNA polymerase sigma factor [Bacteroidia bacterium]
MEEWKDIELFSAIKGGDKKALSVLFLRHYDFLKHYGLRISPSPEVVEECVQELFLYIFEAHDRLGDVKQLKAYLFSSLRRRILEKLSKERKQKDAGLELPVLTAIQFSADDLRMQEASQQHIQEALTQALNELPWRQREAIYLRYYNGLRTKEIAEIMGVANQTILNTLYQALKKIRKNKQLKKFFGITSSLLVILGLS